MGLNYTFVLCILYSAAGVCRIASLNHGTFAQRLHHYETDCRKFHWFPPYSHFLHFSLSVSDGDGGDGDVSGGGGNGGNVDGGWWLDVVYACIRKRRLSNIFSIRSMSFSLACIQQETDDSFTEIKHCS